MFYYLTHMISVVFPVYNEEENVGKLHAAIKRVVDGLGEPYEIIAVYDDSTDNTLFELKKLSPVKIVVFAKNRGQTSALDAGFKIAKGDVVITLDADLQNDPQDIPRLIKKLREGYDVVSGWRKNRHDNWGRRILSRSANWLTGKVTGLYLHDHACAIKAYRKSVLEGVNLYGEMHVFLPCILYLRGAKVAEMEVAHHARTLGFSKHNFLKAVKDISDLLVVRFIFSVKRPLLFFSSTALALWFLSLAMAVAAVIVKLTDYRDFGQAPLPLVAVFLAIAGLLFFALGFLAELLLRVYYESGGHTPYIVKQVIEQ